MKKTLSTILKLIISLAILAFIYYKANFDFERFIFILSQTHVGYFLLSLLGVLVVLGIKSYRWHLLIKNEGFNYSPSKAFSAFMASDAIGIITPGRIGEIARLYYLRQGTSIGFYEAFKTMIADRIYDFFMLGWLGSAGMLYYFKTFGNHSPLVYIVGVLLVLVLLWIIGLRFLSFLKDTKIGIRLPFLQFAYETFIAVNAKKATYMWFITIVAYLMYFLFSGLIMYALQLDPTFIDIAMIMSIMSLSTIIPISVAGFGTREATLVLLFAYYGLSGETAITFSLLHFTAFFLWGGIVGLVYWLIMPISLERVKADSKSIFLLFKPAKKQP